MLILISEATSNSNTVIRQEFRNLRFQMIDNTWPMWDTQSLIISLLHDASSSAICSSRKW